VSSGRVYQLYNHSVAMIYLLLVTLGQVNLIMTSKFKDSNSNSRNKDAIFCSEGTTLTELPFKVTGEAQ